MAYREAKQGIAAFNEAKSLTLDYKHRLSNNLGEVGWEC